MTQTGDGGVTRRTEVDASDVAANGSARHGDSDPAAGASARPGGAPLASTLFGTIAPVSALLTSVALLLTGNGLLGALLPVRATVESFAPLQIGAMGSSYFLGFAVGCLGGAGMVRRVGHVRAFTAMVAIAASVALVHALAPVPVVWWLLRAASGVCFAVLYMVIESWLNECSENATRGTVFSFYTMVNLTVITLGQLMLTLDEPGDFRLFSLAAILVSLAAVPVATTAGSTPAPINATEIHLGRLYATSPVGVVSCLAVGLTNGSFWALAPVYAQGPAIEPKRVAAFMSIAVIAGAMGQWPLGRLSDRIDRRWIILLACAGAAAGGGLLALDGPTWGQTLAFAALFGTFAFPLYALGVAHTNDHVDRSAYVETAGGLLLTYALGAVIGPLVASVCIRLAGAGGMFAFTATVHVATGVFVVYRKLRHVAPPEREHIEFVDALRVAQTISNVDPLPDAEPGGSGSG